MSLILDEHKRLLKLIAKAEATKARGDAYFDGWTQLSHSNLVKAMKSSSGWPPLVNLAKDLAAEGLLEFNPKWEYAVRLTDEGRNFLAGRQLKARAQPLPPLQLSNLHPKVAAVAGQLVTDGHYRQAVLDTFIVLIGEVRARAKAPAGLEGVPLMQTVFSEKAPMLSLGDKDAQLGHMWLYSGAVMAFRNVFSHSSATITDPNKALEILAFGSYLFRMLDEIAPFPAVEP